MDDGKRRFIEFLFANGLKVFEDRKDDRTLKSGRISPWFLNIGEFNDGATLDALSQSYARGIVASGVPVQNLYGIPEKGVSLAGPVASELARQGHNAGWFFTRKMPKAHGEGTAAAQLVVGRTPKNGESVIQLDDVFTDGGTKYTSRAELEALGQFTFPLLAIALDRQEVAVDGKNAIELYEEKTGTKVVSSVSATDVIDYLREAGGEENVRRLERLTNYLRVYGTNGARAHVGKLEQSVMNQDQGVIPACDVETLEEFEEIVKQTADIPGITGYKLGFELGYGGRGWGLADVVDAARRHTDKRIIYDHQKAGSDIPDTGKGFARKMKNSGVDTIIIFPEAGPETERGWIYHALDQGLRVIVGGQMTHKGYAVSEGGWLTDEGILEMYRNAARMGVRDFVVPGNKPEKVRIIDGIIREEGVLVPTYYAPGFVAQGGKLNEIALTLQRFHGIVGRGITAVPDRDYRRAALEHVSQLRAAA